MSNAGHRVEVGYNRQGRLDADAAEIARLKHEIYGLRKRIDDLSKTNADALRREIGQTKSKFSMALDQLYEQRRENAKLKAEIVSVRALWRAERKLRGAKP